MSAIEVLKEFNSFEAVRCVIGSDRPEGLFLDFKSANYTHESSFKRDEVAAVLSSFANTEGGVVVYGVRTQRKNEAVDKKDKRDFPVEIECAAADLATKIKQWAEEFVLPSLPGLQVVPLDGPDGRRVIVVHAPQSALRPHQVRDEWRYYRRSADGTRPMEHAHVELLFRSRIAQEMNQQPLIAIDEDRGGVIGLTRISLFLRNVGNAPAKNVTLEFGGMVLAQRSVLGVGSSYWEVVELPVMEGPANQMGDWKRAFDAVLASEPPTFVVRFQDLAGAVYEAHYALRRTLNQKPPELRPSGSVALRRIE